MGVIEDILVADVQALCDQGLIQEQIAESVGMPIGTLRSKLLRLGWTLESVTVPRSRLRRTGERNEE